jgi:NAD(P)H dehydrogenase (quinone)
MSTFLVTGPTGVVGNYLTHLLLERGHQVRVLAHHADKRSERLEAAGAQIVVADLLDLAAVRAATQGVDGAYFSYPIMPGLVEASTIFAQAAAEAGVGIIVDMSQKSARSEAGSNAARQHWLSERIFNNFPVPAAHIRPTFFAEWLIQFLDDDNTLRLPFGDGRHAPIAGEDQAYVVAGILEHPQGHDGNEYPLYGPVEMNHFQIAEELSDTLGVPFSYEPVSIEAFADTMRRQGFHEHTIQHIENVAQDYRDGIFAGTNDVVEKIGNKTPTSVSEFALRNKEFLVDKQRWGYWLSARS